MYNRAPRNIARPQRPASPKQTALIEKLSREIHADADHASYMEHIAAEGILADGQRASELIDGLIAASKARRADARAKRPVVDLDAIVPGFYAVGDDVYRVKPGKRYAEKLILGQDGDKGHFEYVKGGIFRLDGVTPMTREEAAEMGRGMSHCIRCGRYLEDVDSVARGMGAWCWKQAW